MLTKIKNNKELIPMLVDAGIIAKEYKNPSAVGTPVEFIISTIPGGKGILVKNSEMAKLELATDKDRKQAVLSVREGKRKLSRTVVYKHSTVMEAMSYHRENLLKGKFPINIPGAKLTVGNITSKKTYNSNKDHIGWEYSGVVTATVNRSRENTFLMGMDETSHFISILPEKVNSVEEAHKILRPKGLSKKAKRQGEFFFTPVSEQTVLKAMKGNSLLEIRASVPLERNSNHHAQSAARHGHPRRRVLDGGRAFQRAGKLSSPQFQA